MNVLSSIQSQENHMNKVRTENTHVWSNSISNATLELKKPWKLISYVRKSAWFFFQKVLPICDVPGVLRHLEATYGNFQFGGARFKVRRQVDRRWSQVGWCWRWFFHSDLSKEHKTHKNGEIGRFRGCFATNHEFCRVWAFAHIKKLYGLWTMGIVFQKHMEVKRRDESRMYLQPSING